MEKRRGPSISVKMILTTTALIVLIVVGFGVLNIWTIGRVYDQTVHENGDLTRNHPPKAGPATVQALSPSSRWSLEGANAADLRKYVGEPARRDPEIAYVYVVDANQGLIAHSDAAKNPKEGHPPHKDDSFALAMAAWTARKDKPTEQDPLVAGELGRTAVFALPVFPAA